MRKGLAHAGAWTLATSAAVALSWFGVHHVLAGTAYDPPRALPISEPVAEKVPAPTRSPDGAASDRAAGPRVTPRTSPSTAPARPRGSATPARTSSADTGNVHGYTVEGGRVVLDLGETSATLVSATPDSGWEMKVRKQPEWIRVDFVSATTTSSLFCTWNGHPPTVDTYKAQNTGG
ncbi:MULTISPECIES: hypothetical protein [unclassified Streptomyces]|uniref:hypothetical protein n=1 Tax=unclassified Streptomyces TaxID=2593676 RepID=UPI0003659A10|nr:MULTISPECIES: hypothetical protein [unclassified Streptomyces]MYX34009.1 hypothetical protein [Streptomyces sp. SID8377]